MKYPVPFGRHLLLERINVGGMAEVFKAKSFGVEGFERFVAVKRILPTMAEDEEFITMFVDEARIVSHLTHQNIVQIYELGKCDGNYFISMEYVAGRDLRQILDHQKRVKRPLEVAKACFIISRVCEALEYAHRKKDPAGKDLRIIHRDVSPQNVIISYEGEVKLCDFGIAKAASRASRTQVGVLKGKFAYMSPEQVRGQTTDRRSDLFALGVIFYEMLTGERLFLGESDYSTLESVRNARVPAPTQYNAKIPPSLEKIMLKLLARDPKDRYQWASEVHEDLGVHLINDGRIYHARHLRTYMQEMYARDIEIENAKLEEFMRLKLPPEESPVPAPSAAPVVLAMASDARMAVASDAPDRRPTQDLVGKGESPETTESSTPAPRTSSRSSEEIITSTSDGASLAAVRAQLDAPSNRLNQGESPVPNIASPSPVSNLFGTPQLDGERSVGDDAIVSPAVVVNAPSNDVESEPKTGEQEQLDQTYIPMGDAEDEDSRAALPTEDPEDEFERTQFDALPLQHNDTLFDASESSDEEARPPSGIDEIRNTQSELINRLEENAALDNVETMDADEDSQEFVSPFVFDPSEGSITSESAVRRQLASASASASSSSPRVEGGAARTNVTPAPRPEPGSNDPPEILTIAGPLGAPENTELDFEDGTVRAEDLPGSIPPVVKAVRDDSITPHHDLAASSASRARAAKKSVVRANGAGANGAVDTDPDLVKPPRRILEIRPDGAEHQENGAVAAPAGSASRAGVIVGAGTPLPTALEGPRTEAMSTRPQVSEDAIPLVARVASTQSVLGIRDPRVLMMIAAAIGMVAMALLVALLVIRPPNAASLNIVTEPTKQVEVKIDGKVIGTETPIEISSLELGVHTVELQAKGFRPYAQTVQIAEAKPHAMVVPLEPLDAELLKEQPLAPENPKPDTNAANGDPNPKIEATPQPTATKIDGGSAPEKRPQATAIHEDDEEDVDPDDLEAHKNALINGHVAPPKSTIAPSVSPEGSATVKPAIRPKAAKVEEGFLMVSTKPPGVEVIIDGKKTNLRTPVRHPHPLPAGKHVITFEMDDGQKYSFPITIDPGETKKLIKPLR